MTITEMMDSLSRAFSPTSTDSGSALSPLSQPGTPRKIFSLEWIKRALTTAATVGTAVMKVGRSIADFGFRVTLYGFGLWLVASTAKYLAGPVTKMVATEAMDLTPREVMA